MYLKQFCILLGKELRLGWRLRGHSISLLVFALLGLLLFSLTLGTQPQLLQRASPGILWLTLLFTATLLLYDNIALEEQDGAQEGLLLAGVSEALLFLSKAMALCLLLLLLAGVLLPVALALFDWHMDASQLLAFVQTLLLGIVGLVTPGVLCAHLVIRTRVGPLLLPLLLYPLVLPCLLTLVAVSDNVLVHELGGNTLVFHWFLGLFDLIFLALGTFLFPLLLV